MPNPCLAARHRMLELLVLALLSALAGCDETSDKESSRTAAAPRAHDDDAPSLLPPGASAPMSGSSDFGSSGAAGAGSAGTPIDGSGEAEGGDSASGEPGGGEADAGAPEPIDVEPGQLTAGEWSDLENWSFWRDLHASDAQCEATAACADEGVAARWSTHWKYETRARVPVRVQSGGEPVVDAAVTLLGPDERVLWNARTDSRGRAELFIGPFEVGSDDPLTAGDCTLRVDADSESVTIDGGLTSGDEANEVEFPVAYVPPPSLDLMFMVDTTGSMGDELSYIQAELGHVIEQVRDEIGSQLAVRLSVNFYRDRGDEYVVRDFQFTSEIDQALDQLAEQAASGGGDTPEAVEEALHNAVNDHTWSEAATARLLFFVLDAPPHYTDDRLQSLHDSTLAAAERGVQIIPLAASGIDEQTEFLLRMLAVTTNGTYTFLTDDSGIGNSHLAPTIGQYDVELLADLLVRVIRERL